MKALKISGFVVLGLALIFFVGALILPGNMYFEESKVIPTDPVAAYTQVNDLHNWENWSPWAEMDPEMEVVYDGPEQGEGASYSWEGPVAGNGKLTILNSSPYQNVHFEIIFTGQGKSEGGFNFEGVSGGTKVSWYMEMRNLKYPLERWYGLMMPAMMKKDFQRGLDNIQKVLMN